MLYKNMMTYFLLIAYLKISCLFFLRIYDVIKIIMMTYFLLIVYLKMSCFYYFCEFVIIMMTCFLIIAYLKMTCLCLFYNIVFVYPTIEFITVISPLNKIFIFVFLNNFLYNIYLRSISTFLQFFFVKNTIYYFII